MYAVQSEQAGRQAGKKRGEELCYVLTYVTLQRDMGSFAYGRHE